MTPQKRTIRFQNQTFQAIRLYSSGLGEQFTLVSRDAGGAEKTTFLTEEIVRKDSQLSGLWETCKDAFASLHTFNQRLN